MKNRSITLFILISASTLMGAASTLLAGEGEDGFVNLFNGKDFEGWYLKIRQGDEELMKKVYTVGNGGIVHIYRDLPDGYELNSGSNATHGLFYTEKSYSRFILRFEYKWGSKRLNNFDQYQYDAGCYYHVFNDKIWPWGIEYQVRYNHVTGENHTGDFWAANTTFQWFAGEDGLFQLPSRGGQPQPVKKGEHRAMGSVPFNALNDEWNQCEVIVMGDKYAIHKLNGHIVNMATGLSVGEGIIGFQSETAEIFYRNIKLKELTEDIPMEAFLD